METKARIHELKLEWRRALRKGAELATKLQGHSYDEREMADDGICLRALTSYQDRLEDEIKRLEYEIGEEVE